MRARLRPGGRRCWSVTSTRNHPPSRLALRARWSARHCDAVRIEGRERVSTTRAGCDRRAAAGSRRASRAHSFRGATTRLAALRACASLRPGAHRLARWGILTRAQDRALDSVDPTSGPRAVGFGPPETAFSSDPLDARGPRSEAQHAELGRHNGVVGFALGPARHRRGSPLRGTSLGVASPFFLSCALARCAPA
jgi:hypothetical protein